MQQCSKKVTFSGLHKRFNVLKNVTTINFEEKFSTVSRFIFGVWNVHLLADRMVCSSSPAEVSQRNSLTKKTFLWAEGGMCTGIA